MKNVMEERKIKLCDTLKGSLSVLKLMPGTYFSQTGNPLNTTRIDLTFEKSIFQRKKKKEKLNDREF